MRKIAPMSMWAVVIINPRSTWLNPHTISRTRAEAAKVWMDGWLPEYQERERRKRNKTWRTVRVTVTADPQYHEGGAPR